MVSHNGICPGIYSMNKYGFVSPSIQIIKSLTAKSYFLSKDINLNYIQCFLHCRVNWLAHGCQSNGEKSEIKWSHTPKTIEQSGKFSLHVWKYILNWSKLKQWWGQASAMSISLACRQWTTKRGIARNLHYAPVKLALSEATLWEYLSLLSTQHGQQGTKAAKRRP